MSRFVSFGMSGTQKYRNKPTEVDGIKFPSKKEARRWKDLNLLLNAGRIRNLERQVVFDLHVCGIKICAYRADFVYQEWTNGEWVEVVEDAKGYPTPEYKLKRKLMAAVHKIAIRES